MEFVQSALGALVRHLIGFVGAYLVASGYVDSATSESFVVGVSAVIVSVVWSLINKWFSDKKLDKALALPSNSTRSDL